MPYDTDLTDKQWSLIKPLFPPARPGGRPRKLEPRHVVNAVLYLTRSGCSWRLLPKDFGPWSSVYNYFRAFRDDGTWTRIHDALRGKLRRKMGRKTSPSAGCLDSQSVKTTEKRASGATTQAKK